MGQAPDGEPAAPGAVNTLGAHVDVAQELVGLTLCPDDAVVR